MKAIELQRNADKRPKYLRLAEDVRQQIRGGQLQPGHQLLSYAEIEAQFGFSQNTVERAYAILEEEDLIYRVHGRGVFVKPHETTRNGTGFIGYIDKEFKNSKNYHYYTLLMQGAQAVADEFGKQLVVISSLANFDRWLHLDGVALCSTGHDISYSGEAVRGVIPDHLAVVNSLLPDIVVPSIVADDADGIRQTIEHLIKLKHRRIAYMSQIHYEPVRHHPLVQLRYEAYLSALHLNHISPQSDWVYPPSSYSMRDSQQPKDYYYFGYDGMQHWLRSGWSDLGCTALLAHNDFTAMGVIDALRNAGLRVPEDVSVVGFDGVEVFQTAPYNLTTIRVPLYEIGAMTMRVLLENVQNARPIPQMTKLPVQLVEGGTTSVVPDNYMTTSSGLVSRVEVSTV